MRTEVGQRVDGPLPALGGEEDGGLGHLAPAAGVCGQALGDQVPPGHPEVHRVLDVDLAVGGTLGLHTAHRYLWGDGGTGGREDRGTGGWKQHNSAFTFTTSDILLKCIKNTYFVLLHLHSGHLAEAFILGGLK